MTTSSRERPQDLYLSLRSREERVRKLIKRLVLKHGSVLEHNRFVFLADADESGVLALLLASRFFEVTRLGERTWLLSCNARTIVELLTGEAELPPGAREALSEALRKAAPTLWEKVMGRGG